MTSGLLTTGRIRQAAHAHDLEGRGRPEGSRPEQAQGSTAPTSILDTASPVIRALSASTDATASPLRRLQQAHTAIAVATRGVYALDELRPASSTLRRGMGSCSQRLAVLEAVAREQGIATRARGLLVDGDFWARRFGVLAPVVPDLVLIAWPEFRLRGAWLTASRLFPRGTDGAPFTNEGSETLFDAIGRGAASWTPDAKPGDGPARFLRRDLGVFDSRDELFASYGQNLPGPVRALVGPVFRLWSAGSR